MPSQFTRPAAITWSSVTLALLLVSPTACVPARAPVVLTCSGTQQCPATGDWTCDQTVGKCVACVGACPGSELDDTSSSTDATSTDATSTDATSTDATSTDATSTDATSTDATIADTSDNGTLDAGTTQSCVGRCGEYTEGLCGCDPACTTFEDCCDDYEAVCLATDATSTDSGTTDAGTTDVGATSDSAALPSDTTST